MAAAWTRNPHSGDYVVNIGDLEARVYRVGKGKWAGTLNGDLVLPSIATLAAAKADLEDKMRERLTEDRHVQVMDAITAAVDESPIEILAVTAPSAGSMNKGAGHQVIQFPRVETADVVIDGIVRPASFTVHKERGPGKPPVFVGVDLANEQDASTLHAAAPGADPSQDPELLAYNAGCAAAESGQHRDANPHVSGTDFWDAWDQGFSDTAAAGRALRIGTADEFAAAYPQFKRRDRGPKRTAPRDGDDRRRSRQKQAKASRRRNRR